MSSGYQFAFKLLKKGRSHFILISRNQADFAFQYYRKHRKRGLCIKPVTEPDQTEPTEITELTRPNLRELPNVPDRTYGKCRYIDTGIYHQYRFNLEK